jgi:hypothetical protein
VPTPWRRDLGKLIFAKLIKKLPAFNETGITAAIESSQHFHYSFNIVVVHLAMLSVTETIVYNF